jgi:hypothetical protein
VLDFGLAKACDTEQPIANLSQSPTRSVASTTAGAILGTAAYVQPGTFRADKPHLWSEEQFIDRGPRRNNFDIHPDGQRFVVLKASEFEIQAGKVVFVTNFLDGLEK